MTLSGLCILDKSAIVGLFFEVSMTQLGHPDSWRQHSVPPSIWKGTSLWKICSFTPT